MTISKVVIVHGGELAKDVAEQLAAQKPDNYNEIITEIKCASERPSTLFDYGEDTVLCFIMQTVENAAPTESGGTCVRFFQRKTHPTDLLQHKFAYTVLGLGDSNLLLDRQTTTAKDCNQVAQALDARLAALSGKRWYPLGLADERTGFEEVEPWIQGFWSALV
jgi:sulfite reductase alpha subunit-like flavoprotein